MVDVTSEGGLNVLHVSTERMRELQAVEVSESLRQATINVGFSITYNPEHYGDHRVEVHWSEDHCKYAHGPTLVQALNNYRLAERNSWAMLPEAFRKQWLKVFQQSCPHTNSSPSRVNPLMVFCDDCYKQLG